MVPMAQWVGQQGSEALGTGSNSSISPNFQLYFLTLLIRFRIMRLFSSTSMKYNILHQFLAGAL